ncbi:MAG: hypothetical protein C7B46_01740 [Sulfobacillus benefaciens]|uniref:AB hydrolase-1 domain-containing protein n=1 Tax=Sulfobacillus benefaciens TaxID=453960 RepID=A0A2T2XKZ4_9FIRM|nr:MAG: hypothetical protein C7B46_01740 [Sulfobacillus benefaciens]
MMVQLKNVPIYLRDLGHGPQVLLFLHGWAMSSESWNAILPYFDLSRYRLLMPDVRGFARSGTPLKGYHIDDYMRDSVRLLRHVQVKKVTLIGHSFGGTGALYFASRMPHLVHRVAVFATIPGAASRLVDLQTRQQFSQLLSLVQRTRPTRLSRLLLRIWRQAFAQPPSLAIRLAQEEAVAHAVPHAIEATLHTILDTDITAWLSHIKAQVLVIRGSEDPMLHERTDPLATIPHCQRVLIPGSGHYPQIEKPDLVWQHLSKFLVEQPLT